MTWTNATCQRHVEDGELTRLPNNPKHPDDLRLQCQLCNTIYRVTIETHGAGGPSRIPW